MRSNENRKEVRETAGRGRAIQRKIDETDKKIERKKNKPKAMQAGARIYPEPPLSHQHLQKPGLEADLELKPMYDAPHYKGSEKLVDMAALITGGDSGIGRAVAVCLPAKEPTWRLFISTSMRTQPKPNVPSRARGAAASCCRAMLPIQSFAKRRWQEWSKSSASSTFL